MEYVGFKMLELSLYVVVFIALSGLMAVVEAAVLNVSPIEVEEMRLQGAWGADALAKVTSRITPALVVLVILTNTINVLGPILAGRKAMQLYGDASIGFIAVVLTLGTIVFSEIIPKSIGSHYAPTVSRWSAPLIRWLSLLMYPAVIILEWISSPFKKGERRFGTEAQIRTLAAMGRRKGYIESDERQLVRRAFLLNDLSARDIMTPLEKVVAMKNTNTIREASAQMFKHAFSRYPVFGKSADDVLGVVLGREILQALTEGKEQQPVSSICRRSLTVPAETRSDELLVIFRNEHQHLAVVRDKQKTVGLVTLEDVLEELVGEIEDEKDLSGRAN